MDTGDRLERVRLLLDARQRQSENTPTLVERLLAEGDYPQAAKAAFDVAPDEPGRWVDLFRKHAPAPTPCPDCGEPIPFELNLYFEFWQDRCQACKKKEVMAEKARRLPEIMRAGGVPERYRGADMSDFTDPLASIDPLKGRFFWGTPGTGKTRLMAAMFKKVVMAMQPHSFFPDENRKRWHPVCGDFEYGSEHYPSDFPVFVSAAEMLLKIKSTFGHRDGPTENDIISKYAEAPVLFLDDLGAEYSTEWATSNIFTLIDRRYNNQRLTHISSNLNLEDMAGSPGKPGRLNDRIASRIAEMCEVIDMSGSDRRLKAA